jgi:hypothetical protein
VAKASNQVVRTGHAENAAAVVSAFQLMQPELAVVIKFI